MTHYEAIKNLSPKHMERFLDQVFLTGYNAGHQSLVDTVIDDENPFTSKWLNSDTEESPSLVENENGEALIIRPLADIIIRMAEFDENLMPDKTRTDTWLTRNQLQLPFGISKYGSIGKVTYFSRDVNGNYSFSGDDDATNVLPEWKEKLSGIEVDEVK